jgi:hypothetical protein
LVVGDHAASPGNRGRNPNLDADFPDGLSKTILLTEACGQQIVWTEPRDLSLKAAIMGVDRITTDRPTSPALLSGPHGQGVFVGIADGSARMIARDIDPAVLKAMLTADGKD